MQHAAASPPDDEVNRGSHQTGQSVPVPPLYVERARALLEVLHGMQTAWQSTADADGLEPMKLKPPSKRFADSAACCNHPPPRAAGSLVTVGRWFQVGASCTYPLCLDCLQASYGISEPVQ